MFTIVYPRESVAAVDVVVAAVVAVVVAGIVIVVVVATTAAASTVAVAVANRLAETATNRCFAFVPNSQVAYFSLRRGVGLFRLQGSWQFPPVPIPSPINACRDQDSLRFVEGFAIAFGGR